MIGLCALPACSATTLLVTVERQEGVEDPSALRVWLLTKDKRGSRRDRTGSDDLLEGVGDLTPSSGRVFEDNSATFAVKANGLSGTSVVYVEAVNSADDVLGQGSTDVTILDGEETHLTVRMHRPDFLVNTAPGEGDQLFSPNGAPGRHLASDNQGRFIVTFVDYVDDAYQIFGRMFDPLGDARQNKDSGSVDAWSLSDAYADFGMPAVAMQSDGSFVVLWKQYEPEEDDEEYDPRAKRKLDRPGTLYSQYRTRSGMFDEDVAEIEVQISEDSNVVPEHTMNPAIAALGDNTYAAVWQQQINNSNRWEVVGRLLDKRGQPIARAIVVPQNGEEASAPIPEEEEERDARRPFNIATMTLSAPSSSGESCSTDDSCPEGQVCICDSSEMTRCEIPDYTEDAAEDSFAQGTCFQPAIAPIVRAGPTSDPGSFVVVWNDKGRIRMQLFNKGAVKEGGPQLVSDDPTGRARFADVAATKDGYAVVWSDFVAEGSDTNGTTIRMRRFGADGAAKEDEFSVNTTATRDQDRPAITPVGTEGALLVAWTSWDMWDLVDNLQGGGRGVRARRILSNGMPVGYDFWLNSTANSLQTNATLAPGVLLGKGHDGVITAFEDHSGRVPDESGSGIRARVLFPDYSPTGREIGTVCTGDAGCGDDMYCAKTDNHDFRCHWRCTPGKQQCPHGGICQINTAKGIPSFCIYDDDFDGPQVKDG